MSPLDFFSQQAARANSDATRRRTTSAMTPVVWYAGTSSSACFGGAALMAEPLRSVLVGIGTIPILVGGAIALYFAFRQPDRLQSEEYLTSNRQLDIIATKAGKIVVNPVDLPAVGGPYQLAAQARQAEAGPPPPVTEDGDSGS